MLQCRRPSVASAPVAAPFSASPSLSLSPYKIQATPSILPFRPRPHTHTPVLEHHKHPAPPPLSPPPLEELVAGEGFTFSLSSLCYVMRRHSLSFPCTRTAPSRPEELRPCPPERRSSPPLLLITVVVSPSSPMNVFKPSLHGEQNRPALFPFLCAQHRLHELAGEADPLPSGADRRGHCSLSPGSLGLCACFPATRSTHPRSK
jgi:hypothetical protein